VNRLLKRKSIGPLAYETSWTGKFHEEVRENLREDERKWVLLRPISQELNAIKRRVILKNFLSKDYIAGLRYLE